VYLALAVEDRDSVHHKYHESQPAIPNEQTCEVQQNLSCTELNHCEEIKSEYLHREKEEKGIAGFAEEVR
jgi:hypothetical protein